MALSETEFDSSILHKPTKDPVSDYAVTHCRLPFSFRLKIRAFNKMRLYLIARITWIWGIVALMLLKCWCYMKANYISCSPKVREICSARLRATGSVPRCKTPAFIFLRSSMEPANVKKDGSECEAGCWKAVHILIISLWRVVYQCSQISFSQQQHWHAAPYN